MSTQPRIAFTAVKTLSGLSIPSENFQEGATVTAKAGAVCKLTSGYLAEAGADPNLFMGILSRDGQNGSVAGAKNQQVVLAHPDTVFKGNLDNGSGTYTSLVTDRGRNYGIAKDATSGKWYVDATDQTNKRVIVWGYWDGAQDGVAAGVGDLLAHVYFQFDPAYFQGNHTS